MGKVCLIGTKVHLLVDNKLAVFKRVILLLLFDSSSEVKKKKHTLTGPDLACPYSCKTPLHHSNPACEYAVSPKRWGGFRKAVLTLSGPSSALSYMAFTSLKTIGQCL